MTTVIDTSTPGAREYVHLAALKGAIKLEALGMKRSRGPSALSIAKKTYGFKGDAAKVIEQIKVRMNELLEARQ
jgi:hypothetical protein